MSARLRAAVFGVGHLGRIHARIYGELPDIDLVAVVDTDADARALVSAATGAPGFDASDALPEFDIASVAVPTLKHQDVAGLLLDRGKHVLVEKPLASSVVAAADLVARAAKKGVILSVGHVERFNPAFMAVRDRALEPKFIEVHRVGPFSFRSADIGVVHDLMIHDLDVILSLVGREARDVRAVGAAFIGEHEDVANARIEFEGGCVANLTASRVALKVERKIRVFAPDCYVSMDFGAKTAVILTRNREISAAALGVDPKSPQDLRSLMGKFAFGDFVKREQISMDGVEPLKLEIEAFIASVRGAPPVVTGQDGHDAVALAERILASMREHRFA